MNKFDLIMKRKEFILNNYERMTTRELSEKLEVSLRTIQYYCKKLDVKPLRPITKRNEFDKGYVYLISFGEKVVYIGQTNNIDQRITVHINTSKHMKHSSKWINNMVNKGYFNEIKNCFQHYRILNVIQEATVKTLEKKESEYIEQYKLKGYIVLGGKYDYSEIELKKSRRD